MLKAEKQKVELQKPEFQEVEFQKGRITKILYILIANFIEEMREEMTRPN